MNETTSHATTIGGGSAAETVQILRLRETARLPRRGSERAAGYDLYASEDTTLPAARVLAEGAVEIGRVLVPTGLAMAIPKGLYGRVAPRSGLAVRRGIDVGAGVIDSDYRDELLILLFNLSAQVLEIREGDRIAQIVFERIATPTVVEVDSLEATDRDGGFGSTGLR